jgi:hypothetical protein
MLRVALRLRAALEISGIADADAADRSWFFARAPQRSRGATIR